MAETEYIQVTHRELPFSTFDADNHLYENSDAMTKFLPPEYEGVIKYVEIAGRTKLAIDDEEGYEAIPQYHIVCTSTLATRDPELMGKARADGRLWEVDTGHDLMITEPEATAAALLEVASS